MTKPLHIRGVTVTDGVERDVFVRDGRITFTPIDDARTVLDGGYLIPGLVDAHAHLPFAGPAAPEATWEEKAEASALLQRDAGVLAIRDPGGPTPARLGERDGMPHVLTAGRFLAAPGRMFPEHGQIELPEEEIPEAAELQFKESGSWVKLIGDFPLPGAGFTTSFSAETITAVVRRVHRLGGKVAIHAVTSDTIDAAIESEVDSIEHGLMVTAEQLAAMAVRGIALVPTMVSTGAWLPGILKQLDAPQGQITRVVDAVRRHPATVRAAWEAGVTLLAGTDAGLVPHGLVGDEVRLFMAAGIPATEALAAGSWSARAYFGLPGTEEGAPADLVAFDRNPLDDPGALATPVLIVLAGIVVQPAGLT